VPLLQRLGKVGFYFLVIIFTKALLSRQFVELPKPRIEGLLSAFPKLMGSDKQHTFVETESVNLAFLVIHNNQKILGSICLSTNWGIIVHCCNHKQIK
jgi:hypothetical protein